MNFGRRNSKSTPQAVPSAAPLADNASTPAAAAPRGNPVVTYLKDSYNGLYKIILEPSMPSIGTILLLVVGLLIGLVWAYTLMPKQFAGVNPNRMNQGARDQWILMVAGNYDRLFYNEEDTASLLNQVDSPASSIERLLTDTTITLTDSDRAALQKIQPIAQTVAGTPAPTDPGFISNLISGLLLPLIAVVVITPILVLLWRILFYPNVGAPIVQSINEARNPALKATNDAARADLKRLKEQRAELGRIKGASVADEELGEAVVQLLKVFQKGRPYDESNEIEVGDEFLGQCGSVIPDSLNGDPLAVEVWLFDMQATNNKNFKKMFVAPAAAGDQALLNRLMAESDVSANDIMVMQPGATLVVEGETIRLQNEVLALESDANGRITSFRMKVAAWRKNSRTAPVPSVGMMMGNPAPVAFAPVQPLPVQPPPTQQGPAFGNFSPNPPLDTSPPALRPLSDYDDIQFDPPPVTARPLTPPAFGQSVPQPLGAPAFTPPSFPPPEDDDPFGNTGDFTPLPPRR